MSKMSAYRIAKNYEDYCAIIGVSLTSLGKSDFFYLLTFLGSVTAVILDFILFSI